MTTKYSNEKDGQIAFFENLRISPEIAITNNTDGVYRGVLFEFKLTIPNIHKVLFQAIKYLSHMRIKGESIPKTIMLVALNEEKAYVFESSEFLSEIEKVYAGAASKNNDKFYTDKIPHVIEYNSISGLHELTEAIQNEGYIKVHIDIFDVVGWANRYYAENPRSTKRDFFQEISHPNHFKGLIYAWHGQESDFKFVMDLLNDKIHRKDLGAFYTPPAYCKQAAVLVRQAILRIPSRHDYIIMDRCAGTGNLESVLTDKNVSDIKIGELSKYLDEDTLISYLRDKSNAIKIINKPLDNITMRELEEFHTNMSIYNYLSDNELSHCIVATYELKEWIVLNSRLGDKVKMVIPPSVDPTEGLVAGGDALVDEVFPDVRQYVEDPTCNIIMYENPPFSDVGAVKNNSATSQNKTAWKKSFMHQRMEQSVKNQKAVSSRATNDLSNLFIWSAFEYYLTKPDDYYVLFSPPKYFKSQHLVTKNFIEGYLFNRYYFHTNSHSAISCILWQNVPDSLHREEYPLRVFDIEGKDPWADDAKTVRGADIPVKKVYQNLSALYDKRKEPTDRECPVILDWNGYEGLAKKSCAHSIMSDSILGYLVTQDFGFEHPRLATNLTRCAVSAGHGFFLRNDNYKAKLPLFCAGKYDPGNQWWLSGTVFKNSDNGTNYVQDEEFLKSCLIYTGLSYFNKCISFTGSDGAYYRNELCFDRDTVASYSLKPYSLNQKEQDLMATWRLVLSEAKKTAGYNQALSYGTYQIMQELNTHVKDEETGNTIYDYPALNTKLIELRNKLNDYYFSFIVPKLFKYGLLK